MPVFRPCFLLPLCAEAQTLGPGHGETVSATRQRIADLKLELKRQNTPRLDRASRLAAANRVVSPIHHQVDAFIAGTINPLSVIRLGTEKDLKDILDIRVQEEITPTGFISEPANQRILLIAHEIDKGFMGAGGTSVTLRAYGASNHRTYSLFDEAQKNPKDLNALRLLVERVTNSKLSSSCHRETLVR